MPEPTGRTIGPDIRLLPSSPWWDATDGRIDVGDRGRVVLRDAGLVAATPFTFAARSRLAVIVANCRLALDANPDVLAAVFHDPADLRSPQTVVRVRKDGDRIDVESRLPKRSRTPREPPRAARRTSTRSSGRRPAGAGWYFRSISPFSNCETSRIVTVAVAIDACVRGEAEVRERREQAARRVDHLGRRVPGGGQKYDASTW